MTTPSTKEEAFDALERGEPIDAAIRVPARHPEFGLMGWVYFLPWEASQGALERRSGRHQWSLFVSLKDEFGPALLYRRVEGLPFLKEEHIGDDLTAMAVEMDRRLFLLGAELVPEGEMPTKGSPLGSNPDRPRFTLDRFEEEHGLEKARVVYAWSNSSGQS